MKKKNPHHKREELIDIISSRPFVPKLPIGRKKYIISGLILALVGGGVQWLLLDFGFLLNLIVLIIAPYVAATLAAKRFIHIWPQSDAKSIQIIFYVVFFIFTVLTFIQNEKLQEMIMLLEAERFQEFGMLLEEDDIFEEIRSQMVLPMIVLSLLLLFKKGQVELVVDDELKITK